MEDGGESGTGDSVHDGPARNPSQPAAQDTGLAHPSVTYVELLRFFLPLGIYPFLVQVTKVISNAAIARLPQAETVFAAYSVARSVASPILSPVWVIRQSTVALVDSRAAYRVVRDTFSFISSMVAAIMLVLGFTPAGPWMLREVMGIEGQAMMYHAVWTLRLLALMPLGSMLRNFPQGLVISLEKTDLIPVGTLVRVLCSAAFLYVIVTYQAMSGAAAATLVWAAGIGVEGVLIIIYLRYAFGHMGAAAEQLPAKGRGPVNVRGVLTFFVPLWAASLLGQLVMPVINAGLARTLDPETAIAAFTVGWELAVFFDAPVLMLHQVVIVYASRSPAAARTVFRFSVAVGLAFSALIWLVSFSPVVTWLLAVIIAVPATMLAPATTVMRILALLPLVRAIREFYWGLLMDRRDTVVIGVARAAHLTGTAAVLAAGFASGLFSPARGLHPASLGAFSLLGGEIMETIGVGAYARQTKPSPPPGPPAARAPVGDAQTQTPAPEPAQEPPVDR